MTPHDPTPGLLLVGHGTRSDVGAAQFLDVAGQVARLRPDVIVEPAFLELRQPDIVTAVLRLSERGCSSFVAVPLLLFAAGHAKEDIPQAIEQATRRIPGGPLPWQAAGHLGNDPSILELSGQRFSEALTGCQRVPGSDTCLLLVGRGSSDAEAVEEMRRLAELRREQAFTRDTVAEVRVAFVAKARPALADELHRIAAAGFRRVVVQPHLLFEGEVADSIRRQVAAIRADHSEHEWLVTDVLASSPGQPDAGRDMLSQLIVARYSEALQGR